MKQTLLIVLTIILALPQLALAAKKRKRTRKRVKKTPLVLRYEGRLADEKGKPVSGIYRIRFGLFARVVGGRELWGENHFVAIARGRYVIHLGRKSRIPRSVLKEPKLFIGLLLDGKSVYRERLTLVTPKPTPVVLPTPKQPLRENWKKGARLALKAKFALESQTATTALNAKKLDGMTVQQLIQKIKQQLRTSAVTLVHTDTHYTKPTPGKPNTGKFLSCRKNYVMTGLLVKPGNQIQAICTRLK